MLFTVCVALLTAVSTSAATTPALPVVDLGYERYRAFSYDNVTELYTFSNIRFAAPPVGNLRFAKPQSPLKNRTHIQTGGIGQRCWQATPQWEIAAGVADRSSVGSEDCLFLDVVVPKNVFEGKKKVPVVSWIFGGGYVAGGKDDYHPLGLVHNSNDSIIYVSMNYRLGAFGFTSGPSFTSAGGIANAAFYDQRFALEWVQKYIHLFNGNCKEVTVMGESAGGGSIMHQITAYGGAKGNGSSPFIRAVPQSPGWAPFGGHFEQEQQYFGFLEAAGCLKANADPAAGTDSGALACLRKKTSKQLQAANQKVIKAVPYGTFQYGPIVDGVFVPDFPGNLLAQGAFDHNLTLLIGHNANEGEVFTNPNLSNDTVFNKYITQLLPDAPKRVADYVIKTLYPSPSNKTAYANDRSRASLLISEASFTCNTNYLARAFGNKTNNYLFSVFPAFHGQDVPYTFYANATTSGLFNATVARVMQDYIIGFIKNGKVNNGISGVPYFPLYGNQSTVLDLSNFGISPMTDPTANQRCLWWQKGLYQ